jgi:hypothetical protein
MVAGTIELVERLDASRVRGVAPGSGWIALWKRPGVVAAMRVSAVGCLERGPTFRVRPDATSVGISPSGATLAAQFDDEIVILDTSSRVRASRRMPAAVLDWECIAYSSCGRYLWVVGNESSTDARVWLYDGSTLDPVDDWRGADEPWSEPELSVDPVHNLAVVIDNVGDHCRGAWLFHASPHLANDVKMLEGEHSMTFAGFAPDRPFWFTRDWDGIVRRWSWPELEPRGRTSWRLDRDLQPDAPDLKSEICMVHDRALLLPIQAWDADDPARPWIGRKRWDHVQVRSVDTLAHVGDVAIPHELPTPCDVLEYDDGVLIAWREGRDDDGALFVCRYVPA